MSGPVEDEAPRFEGRHGRADVPWHRRVWRNHLTFSGRTGRRPFFVRVFVVLFTLLILGLCNTPALRVAAGLTAFLPGPAWTVAAVLAVQLGLLALQLTGLSSLASLVARRMHDSDLSGWWALPAFVTMPLLALGAVYAGLATATEAAGIAVLVLLVACALVGSRRGTDGPNAYGERADPHETPPRDPVGEVFT